MERSPKPGYSDRGRSQHKAFAGETQASAGAERATGGGGTPGESGEQWLSMDPRFDGAPKAQNQRVVGASETSNSQAWHNQGELATEASKRGEAAQPIEVPHRSTRTTASPFDLGAPTAGSGASGGGSQGAGGASRAGSQGTGSASQAGQGNGDQLAQTRASRSNRYFLKMYQQVDKHSRFPKKLALAMEQGEVVLSFNLDAKGNATGFRLKKGSGFREFDDEALRAFRAAMPFGAPPAALLKSRDRIRVVAPYMFRNPLIR
jgi:protein TonB